MSKRIKGITVEIGGDTVGLQAALKDVNKRSSDMAKELRDIERLLKFDPNNTELLAQKQQVLTDRIGATSDKLEQLRQAQSQVEAQFQSGEIGEEAYRGFQRELTATEGLLGSLRQELSNMEREQEAVASSTRHLDTLFQATGTSVDDYADALGNRLTNAIRNGTATSEQLEQAIRQVGQRALGADADLDQMRNALRNIDNGSSIDQVRQDLQQLSQTADEAEGSVKELGSELTNLAAGLAAGGGLAGIVEKALDVSSLNTKIDISMEVPADSVESVKASVKTVTAYIDDQEAALEGVRRQWALNKNASDETNRAIVEGAAGITKAYAGVDFIELIQETNEIASALDLSNQEALGLVNSLLKAGFPPEQLDTIAEYGTQMKDTGFSAKEIQAIFEAGIDTKTWNIDNLNDGVKEARITMSEFGLEVDDAMTELLEKAGGSAKQFQEWGKAVAAGGEGGSKAMSEVVTWLDEIDNKELKNELAIKVFGTKWEDQGQNMISVFQGIDGAIDKTGLNVYKLDKDLQKINADPAVQMKQAFADVGTALTPALTSIAELITKIATWVSENPKLAATITAIVTALGILVGLVMGIIPLIGALVASSAALGIGLAPLIGIVAGVVAGIAALIAIGVLLYKNWDEISAKAIEIWGAIKDWFSETWQSIKTGATEMWEGLKKWLSSTWDSIKNTASNVWNSIKDFFKTTVSNISTAVKEKWDDIKAKTSSIFNSVKSIISNIWNGIKTFFSTTIGNIVTTVKTKFQDAVNAIREKMGSARDIVSDMIAKIKGFFNINLFDSGKAIIQSAIDGIKAMKRKILGVVEDIVGAVRDFWPFSPAKRGPLSDIHKMDFAGPISDSIKKAKNPLEIEMDNLASKVANSMRGMSEIELSKMQFAVSNNQQERSITIQPAPIYLDGVLVGQVDFDLIDDGLGSRHTHRAIINGVSPR